MITVSYPNRRVRVPRGLSILEASLRFNVPHASVCGGRARCSTCRVRVVSDRSTLPRPSGREAFVLARVGAAGNPAIRLACQLRPQADVAVIPVLPANVGADFVRNRKRVNIGQERYIVSMFVDMRGSTRLAEARLPFDTVFLINRFLEAASQAVVDGGGQPNQFVGDGLLALFGLHADPATACRQAIRAAAMVASNVEHMNRQFASELQEPIQFGIGIHGGEVIIGDIGFRDHMVFTALGDAVNVAARLQDMTKALNCTVVVSEDVCNNAGIAPDRLTRTKVSIRGRDQPMSVCAAADPTSLAGLPRGDGGNVRHPTTSERARLGITGSRCRWRLRCSGGITGTTIRLSLELEAISLVAIVASVVDIGIRNLQAGLILDLALGVRDRLDDGGYLRIEIGLVLPDLLRRSVGRVHHLLLGVCRKHRGNLRHALLELLDRVIDCGLLVGNIALHHFQHHVVQALGLPSHEIVLLDGNLLLRQDGAGTKQ